MVALAGQVSLVTGGGRGIGRAMALALASAGASVGVVARSADELDETVHMIQHAAGTAVAVAVDVTEAEAVQRAAAEVVDALGPIDLLVNNAGVNRVFGPLWEVDLDDWWNDVTVNLLGPALCSKAVLPSMIARGRGRIVNVSSGTAGRPFPYNSSYAASKAALVRFTDCLAAEVEGYGIKVFALGPGNVETSITRGLIASETGRRWMGEVVAGLRYVPADVAATAVVDLARGVGDDLNGRWIDAGDGVAAVAARAAEVMAEDLFQLRRRKI
jgi:NAD(P)-dependent dehydrogenase (short-subunit alcohol dehydrogenase family)